jgi:hypothetical protein
VMEGEGKEDERVAFGQVMGREGASIPAWAGAGSEGQLSRTQGTGR